MTEGSLAVVTASGRDEGRAVPPSPSVRAKETERVAAVG